MGRAKTIAAGILLGIGLPISLLMAIPLLDQQTPPETKKGAFGALIILGLPPLALGSWLIFSNQRGSKQAERDRLQALFYQLLKEGNGHINALRFSMESKLSGIEAKAYLDDRAKEFNASYNISEEGKLSYYFDGDFDQPALSYRQSSEAYDVIVEYVADSNRRSVIQVIHELTGLDWKNVKTGIKRNCPWTIAQNVNKETADQMRGKLEAAGAKVLVVLR
ncbi:ribosomal protein L7/L12 [Phormidesmis sp. 146-12]